MATEGDDDRRTIFALATAPGRGGVAVVRLSGPGSFAALCRLARLDAVPPARRLVRARLRHPTSEEDLDDGLAAAFPAPGSFTGEDVVELHIHGGRAASAAVIEGLSALPGLRPAEPGEFSRRAFENGKMDLTAAEAIADLVNAETAAQRRQALRQLDGELGRRYEGWRQRLITAMAKLEAVIDFSDEDLPGGLESDVARTVNAIRSEIVSHLADGHRGERLREGVQVAILGAPNVGKSTLLNRLAGRDAAIVSETAGTTRDVIEVRLDLGGYPLTVADTAGIRESLDSVEQEGVRRARDWAGKADLKIVVLDATTGAAVPEALNDVLDDDALVVVNKVDLVTLGPLPLLAKNSVRPVSARSGEGMDELVADLTARAAERCAVGDNALLTRSRHRMALERCVECLERFLLAAESELAAEDLRMAGRELGRITGRVGVEDILDVVFREFCIGK